MKIAHTVQQNTTWALMFGKRWTFLRWKLTPCPISIFSLSIRCAICTCGFLAIATDSVASESVIKYGSLQIRVANVEANREIIGETLWWGCECHPRLHFHSFRAPLHHDFFASKPIVDRHNVVKVHYYPSRKIACVLIVHLWRKNWYDQ